MRNDYYDYPLKNCWINTIKSFLENNGISIQDLYPRGYIKKRYYQDLYYLPERVLTSYPDHFSEYSTIIEEEKTQQIQENLQRFGDRKKDVVFFRKLSDDIYTKTNERIEASDLLNYHFNIYNGNETTHEKYFRDTHNVAFTEYIEQSEIITEIAPENKEIDWWKVSAALLSLLILIFGFKAYRSWQESKSTDLVNTYKADKYGTYIDTLNSPKELSGTWYSYNKSNEPKIGGDKLPYCKIKWSFIKKDGQILIERTYQDNKQVNTSSYGIAEKIGETYHFHLNVRDDNGAIVSKRHFICINAPGKKKIMECLCTMFNTKTEINEHLLVGREILVRDDSIKNISESTKGDIAENELDENVKRYFPKGVPSYLQMISKDIIRFKVDSTKIDSLKIAEIINKKKRK